MTVAVALLVFIRKDVWGIAMAPVSLWHKVDKFQVLQFHQRPCLSNRMQ